MLPAPALANSYEEKICPSTKGSYQYSPNFMRKWGKAENFCCPTWACVDHTLRCLYWIMSFMVSLRQSISEPFLIKILYSLNAQLCHIFRGSWLETLKDAFMYSIILLVSWICHNSYEKIFCHGEGSFRNQGQVLLGANALSLCSVQRKIKSKPSSMWGWSMCGTWVFLPTC